MSVRLHFLFSMLATALIPQTGGAQEFPTETRREIGKFLDATATLCQHELLLHSFP